MVIYDICCDNEHRFEGWFREPAEYQRQLEEGLVSCPVCGSHDVKKLLTGSKISLRDERQTSRLPVPDTNENVSHVVDRLADYIEQNFTDVGSEFPEEARKIFYGEADARNIYGNADPDEVAELRDEGIDVHRIPVPLRSVKKLN